MKINRRKIVTLVTKFHNLLAPSGHFNDSDLQLSIILAEALDRWVSCEGLSGLKRYKAMSNLVVRHLMGVSTEPIPLSNTYIRLISKAKRRCDSHSDITLVKIYWTSILNLHRLYKLKPVEDTSTITNGYKGNWLELLKILTFDSLTLVRQSFSIKQKWSATWKWHISGAAGPNGSLAYTHYLDDLQSLVKGKSVVAGLVILLYTLPYSNRKDIFPTLWNAFLDSIEYDEGKKVNHSKLNFLGDKGGKTRVIASVDILSQSFLKTVHQRCNIVLKGLKSQDGTFDQDHSRRWIKKMSGLNKPLASIDLTAATDRMPALLQAFVLWYLRILTLWSAIGWYVVSTRRDFLVIIKGTPKYVRYTVGQPMGSLSSWPVMAVTHHFLVRLSYAIAFPMLSVKGIKNAPYQVLGDDLSLVGFGVAKVYIRLIHAFGMDYSEDKTYIKRGSAEFAKSLFCNGEELTPFPWALLVFKYDTIVSNVLEIMHECKRRKIPLTASTLTGLYPVVWRNLALLSALSPSAPKYALDLQPREDFWVFNHFLWLRKIDYFSQITTVRDSIHLFELRGPKWTETRSSPYSQIGKENRANFPFLNVGSRDGLLTPRLMLGHKWISYCTRTWPDGPPDIGSDKFVPGPTFEVEKDCKIFRSSLLKFNKLMPGYFHTRCAGIQVGE